MSGELKPCPFCGGKAELICAPGYFKTGLSSSGWLVKCLNGCVNQMPYMSDHDAIEAWNIRATIEPEPEIIRCRDCKYWREHKYAKETKRYIPFCGFNAIYTKADDFCSRAERRGE